MFGLREKTGINGENSHMQSQNMQNNQIGPRPEHDPANLSLNSTNCTVHEEHKNKNKVWML